MCLIIDANVCGDVIGMKKGGDFSAVWSALLDKKAIAVYGGKLAREYARMHKINRIIKELDRIGMFRKVNDTEVDSKAKELEDNKSCLSDDQHIIALALISNARLLCSNDKTLHADFTNANLMKPAGNIYQKPAHKNLIKKHCC